MTIMFTSWSTLLVGAIEVIVIGAGFTALLMAIVWAVWVLGRIPK